MTGSLTLSVTLGSGEVHNIDVPVVAILGDAITYSVVGRAAVTASPYRSSTYAP